MHWNRFCARYLCCDISILGRRPESYSVATNTILMSTLFKLSLADVLAASMLISACSWALCAPSHRCSPAPLPHRLVDPSRATICRLLPLEVLQRPQTLSLRSLRLLSSSALGGCLQKRLILLHEKRVRRPQKRSSCP